MVKLIVCLTGMPGAGKSTIANGLKQKGYKVINMGDAVRAEAKRRNIELTGDNLGKLMLDMRKENGQGAIAHLVKSEIEKIDLDVIIIDGIRSNDEIDVLNKVYTLKILSIHASTNTRFDFLTKRGRSDDPTNKESFTKRDDRELGIGINTSIALADESLSNNNLTIEELVSSATDIIQSWIK